MPDRDIALLARALVLGHELLVRCQVDHALAAVDDGELVGLGRGLDAPHAGDRGDLERAGEDVVAGSDDQRGRGNGAFGKRPGQDLLRVTGGCEEPVASQAHPFETNMGRA